MRKGTPMWVPISIAITFALFSFVAVVALSPGQAKAILGIGTILLVAIALYNSRFDAGREVATASAGLGIILGFLLILSTTNLLQRAVPLCGDEVCARGECSQGCPDCTPQDCADGSCQAQIESCATSADCACLPGNVCDPGRNLTDAQGCAPVTCGDAACDYGEASGACCTDCGCAGGYACQQNTCIFLPPKIEVLPFQLTTVVSASTMAVGPRFLSANDTSSPLAAVVLKGSVSTANNINVTFAIFPIIEETVRVESLTSGQETAALWYPTPSLAFLTVTQNQSLWINMTIRYTDARGAPHIIRRAVPMTVLGRGFIGPYGHITYYVTPNDVPTTHQTPSRIWEEFSNRLTLVQTNGNIQYPAETLYHGTGSQRDIALVLASAFQRAGLSPSIVTSGQDTFVWVREGDDFVVLDPARINDVYETAVVRRIGQGAQVESISRVWLERNVTPARIATDLISGALVRYQREMVQDCSNTNVQYIIRNDGRVDSPVCARSLLLLEQSIVSQQEWCITLAPQSRTELTHTWASTSNACRRPDAVFTVEER